MRTALLENLEFELEMAANALSASSRAEAESGETTRVYFDSWTYSVGRFRHLHRDGPFDLTKDEAIAMIPRLQKKHHGKARVLGGGLPVVQCLAYHPSLKKWVPCGQWK